MTKEEIELRADEHLRNIRQLQVDGVISRTVMAKLRAETKGWHYDKIKEVEGNAKP